MSGILKKIKKHASRVVNIMFLLLCAALILLRLYILVAVIFVIAVVNRMTVRKMNKQKEPFEPRSVIRNLDYIIIGDVSESVRKDISGSGTGICIRSPECSFAAVYEILKHTFSILREQGGKAVIVVGECKE